MQKFSAQTLNRYFLYSLLLIAFSYFIIQCLFNPYGAISADEFVFARHIFDYTFQIPYRDFSPYKTVLGYYVLSIPMFFSHDFLQPLFYIKDEIALINACFMLFTSFWLARIFNPVAITLTLLFILANQLFLVYGTDLRVDMLTCWFCLFSAISVLTHRMTLGGLLMGIAFLISQKALWYLMAVNGAMFFSWLIFSNYTWREVIKFNAYFAVPIIVYVLFWSMVSSPTLVLHNLFYEAYIQAGINWYMPIYLRCWSAILHHGPLIFLLWPLTFLCLYDINLTAHKKQQQLFILAFATIALCLFINYKQPFPYNAVFTIPAFFLLYPSFFSWLFSKPIIIPKKSLPICITLCFLSTILSLSIWMFFELPIIYTLTFLIPVLLLNFIFTPQRKKIYEFSLILLLLLTGVIAPFYYSAKTMKLLDGHYQQTMLRTTAALLAADGDYIGGIPFIYTKEQPITGLKNLIGPAIEYISTKDPQLEPLLLSSIYLAPTDVGQVLADFERTPVKVIVNNYRMLALPPQIRHYITSHYSRLFGSIYIYAPTVSHTDLSFHLTLGGNYRISTNAITKIRIDGKQIDIQKVIRLEKGDHFSNSTNTYQLILVPPVNIDKKTYPHDEWYKMIKAIIA